MLPLTRQTVERVAAGLPVEVRPRLEAGAELFETMDMPDPREEDWRYVELDVDLDALAIPEEPGEPLAPHDEISEAVGPVAGRAVIVDGKVTTLEGDQIVALGRADPTAWKAGGPAAVPAGLDRFSAAQHAFGGDGAAITIPAGRAVGAPFLIDVQAVTPGALVLPRVVVAAADGAEASVVILYRSPDGVPVVVVPNVEVTAATNARVAVTSLRMWGDETISIAHQHLVGGRDAGLTLAEVGMGGRFGRLHLTVDLDGQGADARILGLYFGDTDQTHDYRAFMNHNAPNTTSDMFLKGAVGDTARSVFTGLIRIEPEGQKTNAFQTNRNLVLSEGAEAHSVPNLEILANDVRCGHGSAVGPLDAEQRYYLMSRGLDRAAADRLQVKGFFEEVLTRFPILSLEPPLRKAAMAKYAGIVARGRS